MEQNKQTEFSSEEIKTEIAELRDKARKDALRATEMEEEM